VKLAYFLTLIVPLPMGRELARRAAGWIERGKNMFLIRTAFWLIIIVLLLPTNEQQQNQVYGTAQAAVKDVSGFCDRNPGVCTTGKDAFAVFVEKAQFGASLIMSFVREQTGGAADEPQPPSAAESGATEGADARHSSLDQSNVSQASLESWPVTVELANVESLGSQNTLNARDLAPAWSGPHRTGI
jgi:hypothetical protein